jgi:hypothetical protein
MRRLFLAPAALVVALLLLATPAGAANVATLWTLVASPTTVSTGVTTQFVLLATNNDPALLDGRIQCITVEVPTNFDVLGATAGSLWTATRDGNRVSIFTGSGGNRLDPGDQLTFWISAFARSTGSLTWASRAFERQDCTGTSALLTLPPIVLVIGPAVTPSPLPTATARPTATPAPTARPTTARPTATPTLPLPTLPLPTLPPSILPIPITTLPPLTPRPSATPGTSSAPAVASGSPAASARAPAQSGQAGPSAAPSAGIGAVPGGEGAPPAPGEVEPSAAVGIGPGGLAVETRAGAFGDGLSVSIGGNLDIAQLWFVPAAVLGGPGLLVLLWVGVEVLAGIAWLPAARRLRGDEGSSQPVSL